MLPFQELRREGPLVVSACHLDTDGDADTDTVHVRIAHECLTQCGTCYDFGFTLDLQGPRSVQVLAALAGVAWSADGRTWRRANGRMVSSVATPGEVPNRRPLLLPNLQETPVVAQYVFLFIPQLPPGFVAGATLTFPAGLPRHELVAVLPPVGHRTPRGGFALIPGASSLARQRFHHAV